jgi:protein O-mannosyl-transferase
MVLPEHNSDAILKSRFVGILSNPVFLGLLLAATTLIIFWPVTRCDFLNYDDPDYFTANPRVLSGLTPANFIWAFTTGHAGNWHPLTWLSLMLDAELFGKNPFGPHFTNLFFHAANATLLFLLLQKLTAAPWRSAFIAALFALHPLHVESVAWISERKDVLSTFFVLLSLWAYVAHTQKFKPSDMKWKTTFVSRNYWLSLFLFTLALMSKPMVVTLPFVMLLLDWWPLQRISNPGFQIVSLRRLFMEKIPFFVLSSISCAVTFAVQQKGGAVAALTKFSISQRIENTFVAYARYLGKMFWPVNLANPYPLPGHWELSLAIYSVALIAGLSAIAVLFARRFPFAFTGWFWFVGTLVPVIGLVQVGDAAMADRYTYFPLIGIFIVLVWSANFLFENLNVPKSLVIFCAAIILAACAFRTRDQLNYWQNSGTLFRHTLAVTENNYIAENNLGTWLSTRGKVPEAMDFFRQSLRIKAENPDAFFNLGNAFAKLGNWDEAINDYQQALQITPDQADILNNLGFALAMKKQFSDAIACFEAALKLNPGSADTHNNLATVYFMEQKFSEAAQHYREAIRLAPDNAQIYANLGDVLVRQRQLAEAVQNYQTALRLNPDDARTRAKLQALGAQTSN